MDTVIGLLGVLARSLRNMQSSTESRNNTLTERQYAGGILKATIQLKMAYIILLEKLAAAVHHPQPNTTIPKFKAVRFVD